MCLVLYDYHRHYLQPCNSKMKRYSPIRMKRLLIGFCLVLLVGYVLVALLNLPTFNAGLLKLRGFCNLCDLTNTNLEAMDLHGADLTAANLIAANLPQANLTDANLTDANLTTAVLKDTIYCNTIRYDGTINSSSC